MVNRSTFPQSIDQFTELSNLLSSDKANVERYQTLLMQTTRTVDEENELTNLKNILKNKIIDAEQFNLLQDSITNLQDYFLNQVMEDLSKLDISQHVADTDDPHESFAQAVSWVKGFGLGDAAKDISNTNLNNLDSTSFNYGGNLTNAPSTGFYWIVNIKGASNVKVQIAITKPQTSIAPNLYIRYFAGVSWFGWTQFISDASPTFNTLPLQNGTTAVSGRIPRYTKVGKLVTVEGEINNISAGTIIATLPTGYRPPYTRIFKVALNTSGSNDGATLYAHTDGTIVVQSVANIVNTISLMGISFYVD